MDLELLEMGMAIGIVCALVFYMGIRYLRAKRAYWDKIERQG